jgi:exoribonuclease R
VEIHIADAAEFIRGKSQLDDSVKKRDKTVYIKNYHQPMVPDSLKKMLSLHKAEEKLTYGLRFEVTPRGFIDYSTVKFFKGRVVVEDNLSH